MKITLKGALMAMMCVVGMTSLVACGDDDAPIVPPVIEPTIENGSYKGGMTYVVEGSDVVSASEAVEFEAKQSSIGIDSLVFADFPIKGLVTATLTAMGASPEEAPAAADGLIAQIGKVSYTIYYTAKATTEGMEITLAPKALELNVAGGVTVSVDAVGTGKYVAATKKMTFSLKAKSVKVGTADFPTFKAITLNFDATKQ